jgi:hypothetical protein
VPEDKLTQAGKDLLAAVDTSTGEQTLDLTHTLAPDQETGPVSRVVLSEQAKAALEGKRVPVTVQGRRVGEAELHVERDDNGSDHVIARIMIGNDDLPPA